jgi:pilus assembly protein CpaB
MKRPYGFFLLAGFAASLAALIVYSALKRREADVQKAMVQSVSVVVAAHDLTLGAKLDGNSVKLVRWSRDALPAGSFTDPAAVFGSVVKASFVENEPIVASKLFNHDANSGVMPMLIPAGMRAISIAVDEVSDISGFVQPHQHVDVLVAMANGSGDDNSKPIAQVVLQNVEVLAVAQQIEKKKDEPQVVHVVTLLVSLEEAERLALASREGSLRLVLRGFNDSNVVLTRGTTVGDMLRAYAGGAPAPSQPSLREALSTPKKAPGVEVEILRNGRTSESLSFINETSVAPVHADAADPSPAPAPKAINPHHYASETHHRSHATALAAAAPAPAPTAQPASGFAPTPKTIDIP